MTDINEATFQAALPTGWSVSTTRATAGWIVRASHVLFGDEVIGPKSRLVPADVKLLRKHVDQAESPTLSYSQWLASGERFGFAGPVEMTSLTRALRLLAICIERGDLDESEVAQALLTDGGTVLCPIEDASDAGMPVAELMVLLHRAMAEHEHTFCERELASARPSDTLADAPAEGHANARVWTAAELAKVWHVEGWTWGHVSGSVWALYCDAVPDDAVCMAVTGRLCIMTKAIPPAEVLLAVIGAHQGRDSIAVLADHLRDEAKVNERARSTATGPKVYYCDGAADAFASAEAMLRSGKVPA